MSGNHVTYPFTAVYGMEDAKRALACTQVDPDLRTVLIRGGPGTAKTVLARSFGSLCGRRVVNVPLNATEERIFGGLDMEATVRDGTPVASMGLLREADGGILYVDDANLMDQRLLLSVLDCVREGEVVLEREGISCTYTTDTVLVATMNPEDSDVGSHVLDRFDLCAYSDFPDGDIPGRREVLRRSLRFNDDGELFASEQSEAESAFLDVIRRGRAALPLVTVSDELMEVAVGLTERIGCEGSRGGISLIRAARAIAAMNGNDAVSRKDLEEAAMIALPHRRGYAPEPPGSPPPQQDIDQDGREDGADDPPDDVDGGRDGSPKDDNRPEDGDDDSRIQSILDDMMFEIGRQFRVIDYLESGPSRILHTSSRKGRRGLAESTDSTGRYVRARVPEDRVADVAFDATLRAAAPYQRNRTHDGLAVTIEKQDIRRKVRERRSGCTILFLVDASGSLGVRRRMSAVKGAVMSMLRDSYVKRDSVGLMAFRRDSAELLLPPTRSVEYSYRRLEDMPTGGKTPLPEALVSAEEFMTAYTRSHPGELCYVVLVTDGRANVPLTPGADANEESVRIASDISIPCTSWIVIDAGAGYVRFDHARRLAEGLKGTYLRLEELDADRIADVVRRTTG